MFAVEFLDHPLEVLSSVVELAAELTELASASAFKAGSELALRQFSGIVNDLGETLRDLARDERGKQDRRQERQSGCFKHLFSDGVHLLLDSREWNAEPEHAVRRRHGDVERVDAEAGTSAGIGAD